MAANNILAEGRVAPIYRCDPNYSTMRFGGASGNANDDKLGDFEFQISSSCGAGGTSLYITVEVDGKGWRYMLPAMEALQAVVDDVAARIANGESCPRSGQDANGVPLPKPELSAEMIAAREREAETRRINAERAKAAAEELARMEKLRHEEDQKRFEEMGFGPEITIQEVREINQQTQYATQYGLVEYREPDEKPKPSWCWIAPDGRTWSCERAQHENLGDAIAAHEYGEGHTTIHLEERGWIKIGNLDYGVGRWYAAYRGKHRRPMSAAVNAVFDVARAFEESGKPRAGADLMEDWKSLADLL